MDLKVSGGQTLSGTITPSGSKNAAVALIPASILFREPVRFTNVPDIKDVDRLTNILKTLGSKISWNKEEKTLDIDNSKLSEKGLGKDEVGNMRGTALLWGPMLARFGKVSFDELPGGCTLGARPLNPHYEAFEALGVDVTATERSTSMDASNAKAATIWLSEMSPTVTENVVMLAVTLSGYTKVIGAASEPNVQDLCNFLNACGADIKGIGSSVLEINGGKTLSPVEHKIISDHYEIATFLTLGAVTGGEIKVTNAIPEHFTYINQIFKEFGVKVEYDGDTAIVKEKQKIKIECHSSALQVKAQPWPGLPVDMLPLFMPLALAAPENTALFHNWMYESGLFWTSEFQKYGADVLLADPHRVLLTGGNKLYGSEIEAPYIIRAVVSLMMAAMIADGDSLILNADAIHRGHPNFVQNLRSLGAKISEV
jgi:UDP-N-acetylglucosamine 1-carboxyvinyltransferase